MTDLFKVDGAAGNPGLEGLSEKRIEWFLAADAEIWDWDTEQDGSFEA